MNGVVEEFEVGLYRGIVESFAIAYENVCDDEWNIDWIYD